MTTLGVVVVTYQSSAYIEKCLRSLESEASIGLRVVVVDNASIDDTLALAREAWPGVQVITNGENAGFSKANNQGLAALGDIPYVVFLNPDTEVAPGAFTRLLDVLQQRDDVGAVGPKTTDTDGTPQLSFGPDLSPLSEWRQRRRMNALRLRDPEAIASIAAETATWFEPDWLSASCLMVRTGLVHAVGGFDEGYFLYEEDADLCLRLRHAGWKLVFAPEARVVHHLGRSVATTPHVATFAYHQSHLRYYAKHNGVLATALLRAHLFLRSFGKVPPTDGAGRHLGAKLRRLAVSKIL